MQARGRVTWTRRMVVIRRSFGPPVALAALVALALAAPPARGQSPVGVPVSPAPGDAAPGDAAPGTLASDRTTGRPITLADAVHAAQRNAPAAIQARGQVRASAATLRAAYAAFLPTVQVSTGLTRQNNVTTRVNPTTGEIVSGKFQSTSTLAASMDLFDGFRRVNDVRAARAQGAAADVGTRAAAASLALQVKQQYFAALAARETEAAAGAQLTEARQQLTISTAKVNARTATRSDSLRAVIAVSQAELAALTARADRANADAALTRVIGSDAPVSATPSGLPSDSALTADSAVLARRAADAPLVRQAVANEQAARAQVRAARSAYFPTVSLAYGRNLTSASPAFDPFGANYVTSGQLRLNVGLPLFDQFSRTRDVANAEIATANAEAAVRDQRLAAQQTLVQALTALRTAGQQVATQTQSVAAAEEDLRVQRQRYQLGASTLLDVLTSQTQLTNARLALVQARFAARTARAQLEALVGGDQ